MRRFKNVVRWNKFWRDKKKLTKTEFNELNKEENSRFITTGLNTALEHTFKFKTAKHGSDNLEGFLTVVEKTSPGRISNANASNYRTRKQEKSTKFFRD